MTETVNLGVSIAFSSGTDRQWKQLGKLWAAMMLRHVWRGDVLLFTDFEESIYPIPRRDFIQVAMPRGSIQATQIFSMGQMCRGELYRELGKVVSEVFRARPEISQAVAGISHPVKSESLHCEITLGD